jgi:hypothetical protein
MTIRLAGAELIGLAGFTASFLRGGEWLPYLVGAPIAIVLIGLFFPRASDFIGPEPAPNARRPR